MARILCGGQKIRLTIDHRTSGVDTLTPTQTTDGNGEAEFTWKRTAAGVDDLTAIELIDIQPQQDSARHTWESEPHTSSGHTESGGAHSPAPPTPIAEQSTPPTPGRGERAPERHRPRVPPRQRPHPHPTPHARPSE